MKPPSNRTSAVLAILIATSGLAVQAGLQITAFPAAPWPTTDAALGITGYAVEDFEDTTLVAGLQVGWETPAGSNAPAATLPHVFDPASDPGGAFAGGAWDGTHGLLNTRDNQAHGYSEVANWGDVILRFDPPVRTVGFSMQQMDMEARLVVDGVDVGGLLNLTGWTTVGRQGYIRIEATGGSTISRIVLRNGRASFNDGFLLDHLAFESAGVPFAVVAYPATPWPASDQALGVAGFVVEDFEDTQVTAGLSIGWETPAGNTAPSGTLPNTFDPATDPGGAFLAGVWDGAHCLANTRDNQAHSYYDAAHWGNVILQFDPPVLVVGFSLQQLDLEARLVVNGTDIGGVLNLTGWGTAGRQGYLRLDATGTNSITQIRLLNGRASFYDGFALDHLAYLPAVPRLSVSSSGNDLLISFPSVTGRQYQFQSATNLPTVNWRDESLPFPGTGGVIITNFPMGPEPAKFFRAKSSN